MKKFMVTMITLVVLLCAVIVKFDSSANEVKPEYDKMYTSYLIQKGDTLSDICHDLYYSDDYVNFIEWDSYKDLMDEVLTMNSMKPHDRIYAGNYIVIPYCVEN